MILPVQYKMRLAVSFTLMVFGVVLHCCISEARSVDSSNVIEILLKVLLGNGEEGGLSVGDGTESEDERIRLTLETLQQRVSELTANISSVEDIEETLQRIQDMAEDTNTVQEDIMEYLGVEGDASNDVQATPTELNTGDDSYDVQSTQTPTTTEDDSNDVQSTQTPSGTVHPNHLEWIPSSIGHEIPEKAVVGGSDNLGDPLYVCRASHRNNFIPGKLPNFGQCFVSWGGVEHSYHHFEVLTNPYDVNLAWVEVRATSAPEGAVEGGTDADGTLYIGRNEVAPNTTVPGKMYPYYETCYASHNGVEIHFPTCEVLVVDSPSHHN